MDRGGAGWWCAASDRRSTLDMRAGAIVDRRRARVCLRRRPGSFRRTARRSASRFAGPRRRTGSRRRSMAVEPTISRRAGRGHVEHRLVRTRREPCAASGCSRRLAAGAPLGRRVGRSRRAARRSVCGPAAGIGVGVWRWDADPCVVDLAGFDPDQRRGCSIPVPTVPLASGSSVTTIASRPSPRRRPSSPATVNHSACRGTSRSTTRFASLAPGRPAACPLPWIEPGAFRAWLAATMVGGVQRRTRSPISPFPPHRATTADVAFAVGAERAVLDDDAPLLVVAPAGSRRSDLGGTDVGVGISARAAGEGPSIGYPLRRRVERGGRRRIGYLTSQLGLARSPSRCEPSRRRRPRQPAAWRPRTARGSDRPADRRSHTRSR